MSFKSALATFTEDDKGGKVLLILQGQFTKPIKVTFKLKSNSSLSAEALKIIQKIHLTET
jgi:hypothetical protein